MKDFQIRFSKISQNAHGDTTIGTSKSLALTDEDEEEKMKLAAQFERLYQNDKVILSIEKLHQQQEEELGKQRAERKRVDAQYTRLAEESKGLKAAIDAIQRQLHDMDQELARDLEARRKAGGGSKE